MKRSTFPLTLASLALSASASAQTAPTATPPSNADSPAESKAVSVVVRDPDGVRRMTSLELNPLSLVAIGKLSANVVILPVDHHAVVISPFYVWATTKPLAIFDDAGGAKMLPEQKFEGLGAELGYRYYTGIRGPRGVFLGPSIIIGWEQARAANGATSSYGDFGLAFDAGYQVLLGDRVSLSLGGGIQGLWTTKAIPDQQFPARLTANRAVNPRVLFSVGWAF